MTYVGSCRMCLDPDVVLPLAGFRPYAMFCITPGTMFRAATTLFEKKFLLFSSLAACGFKFKGSAALLVVVIETSTL
jgi:hypothetical protein